MPHHHAMILIRRLHKYALCVCVCVNHLLTYCHCQVPYILYHGTKPDRVLLRRDILRRQTISEDGILSSFPVVVTSYEIAMNDCEFLANKPWKMMIVDEGHRIKNFNCRLFRWMVVWLIVYIKPLLLLLLPLFFLFLVHTRWGGSWEVCKNIGIVEAEFSISRWSYLSEHWWVLA